jgi:CheY-like chemotaxis protein
LPIIAQTAYALPSEIKKYGKIFDDYITKPINEKAFLHTLSQYTSSFKNT